MGHLALFILLTLFASNSNVSAREINETKEFERVIGGFYGDTIRIELERMLKSATNKEISSRISLELGKLAYAQGLYKKAFETLKYIENDTAYFFAALSARILNMDSISMCYKARIKDKTLLALFPYGIEKEPHPGRFYLQFGALDSYERAKKLADRLLRRGLNAFVVKKNELYYVRSGWYKSETDAELEGATLVPDLLFNIIKE